MSLLMNRNRIITVLSIALAMFMLSGLAVAEGKKQAGKYGDLPEIEHADPLEDVKEAINDNDLRFCALMGITYYFPGLNNNYKLLKKYGYQLIEGASDVVIDEEHSRLIEIAEKYAEIYNIELLKHIKPQNSKE